jgi:hypothetical protein
LSFTDRDAEPEPASTILLYGHRGSRFKARNG